MARRPKAHIASPRYWPTWLGLALLWLAGRHLSYPFALRVGAWLGRLIHRLARRRRQIAEVNLRLCFPELSEAERSSLRMAHFEALGIGLILTGYAWWASDAKIRRLIRQVDGLEHLEACLSQGRGALLLGSHFTDLEISGRLFIQCHPTAVMYRRHENPVIEWAFSRNRQRNFVAAIPREDMRKTLRTLKENHSIWYATDQSFKGPGSTLAPFFQVPAATHTGTSRLAKISRAPVLTFNCIRLPGNQGFHLIFKPPLEGFPSEDARADATRINALIEEAVRLAPEQYLWTHRRFKKRQGLPDPY
ncbi:MAG: LpxL/LpxP family Kdo(2)-lipid IV(A) lauroyl/palmitoleoyl acyltransferase [Gammaproteobacteria bacterium]|nr:LpxL/LpxP family Kdo(2)-lipid IV(A) lauroyl/palmitoleoyl acyltransferase [Gammaproteobacteria bacterium]